MSLVPDLPAVADPRLAPVDAMLSAAHARQRFVGAVGRVRRHRALVHASASGRPDMSLRHRLSHGGDRGCRFLDADAGGPHARAGVSDGMDDSPISLRETLQLRDAVYAVVAVSA